MALEIYVGNYPVAFTSDDLLNLFQDFKGIELVRNKNENGKCFSFLRCLDEDQIVDIVTTMHDIDVCGRNLIVRASNKKLQNVIVEELLENDVLDKHPRNIHRSHLGVNQNFNVQKNVKHHFSDEVVSDFPIGVRFINPRLQSLHVENKSDSVDQQRSSSRSSEYHHKSPTQSKCEKECIPSRRNVPIRGIGVSKYNDSSQNVSQDSNKHDTKAQNFSVEEASFPNYRQFEDCNPGRPNFVDRTTERNPRFITPRFRSPHVGKDNDYVDHQNHGSQISTTAHIKSTKEVFKNPCQSSSSSLGTGVSKHNSSYQNSSQASYKPDTEIQNFPDGGASIHKYELQHYKSSSPGKQSFANESSISGKENVANRANESSNSGKQNVATESSKSGKQNVANCATESSKSGKQNVAICANESRYYDAKGGDFSHSGSYSTSSDHQRDNLYNILNDDREIDGAFQLQSLDEPACNKDIFYVSVINFPFNTSISDLYYLFEDFDPFNIIMICNFPLLSRKPTEAILCFESQDQATDAILNFDNTFYRGRSLVVADTTDLTMVPALLSMGLKDI